MDKNEFLNWVAKRQAPEGYAMEIGSNMKMLQAGILKIRVGYLLYETEVQGFLNIEQVGQSKDDTLLFTLQEPEAFRQSLEQIEFFKLPDTQILGLDGQVVFFQGVQPGCGYHEVDVWEPQKQAPWDRLYALFVEGVPESMKSEYL